MFKLLLLICFLWLIFRIGFYLYRNRSPKKSKDNFESTEGFDRSKIEEAEFVDVEEKKDGFRDK